MISRQPLRFGIKTAQRHATYEPLLSVWQAADAIPTFEHAWLNDHFMADPPGPYLEAWTLLAALAAHTTRIRVGIMVTGNTYRHPAVLAKIAATVDVIAHGRLNFGIGTGWDAREHQAYGIPLPPPGERIRRLDEACELIRRLWTEPTVTFEGRYYQLRDTQSDPKPPQQPFPPFVIGGEGEQTLRVIARHANIWDCSVDTLEEYQHKSALLDEFCADIGRDPATIERSRHISIDPTNLQTARLETRTFIEAGANYIIYHVPVPDPSDVLHRLAAEVAEPLRAEYQATK